VTIENAAEEFADKARDTLVKRLNPDNYNPPDLFQANIGSDLLRWETKLTPLDDLAAEQGWLKHIPKPIIELASAGGKLYGVPVNVHRNNTLYYNVKMFKQYDLPVPTANMGIEEFNALLVKIKGTKGLEAVAPMSIGIGKGPWTLALMVHEAIFPAMAGADYYTKFWSGNGVWNVEDPTKVEDEKFKAAIEEALFIYCGEVTAPGECKNGFLNADFADPDFDWTAGIKLFAEGKAAMTVMGDWAKPEIEAAGMVPGTDFAACPFPESGGTFVWTADTFAMPKDPPHPKNASLLLETLGSKEGQLAFNRKKGSIPVRTDLSDSEGLDPVAKQTMLDFKTGTLATAVSGLRRAGAAPEGDNKLRESLDAATVDIYYNYMRYQYPTLRGLPAIDPPKEP
jgi:glucose/mannose transport system substrate-binding protein